MQNPNPIQEISSAIRNGEIEKALNWLGEDPERLNITMPLGTWMHVAAFHGRLEIVKWLVSKGIDVNRKGGISNDTPINEASSKGHSEIVRFLISSGADLPVAISENNPLFSAIYGGHIEVARLLIEAGIDTQVKYTGKYMKEMDAFAFANEWGRSEIAYLIAESQRR